MKYLFFILFLALACLAQDAPKMPRHRSAITPPVILAEQLILRRMPTNTMMLHVPLGKEAEMFYAGTMETDEVLEKIRTNRHNIYLIELRNRAVEDLMPVLISPADLITLSNLHRAEPQHP